MKLTTKQAEDLGLKAQGPRKRTRKAKGGPGAVAEGRVNPALFRKLCESHGLIDPGDPGGLVEEFEFAAKLGRKFRADFVLHGWLILEVNGGNWVGGRHVRPGGLEQEYEKVMLAVQLGYVVVFCTPEQVEDGSVFPMLKACLGGHS